MCERVCSRAAQARDAAGALSDPVASSADASGTQGGMQRQLDQMQATLELLASRLDVPGAYGHE